MVDYGDARASELFWAKVYPCPVSGCWLWGGSSWKGYGKCTVARRTWFAHRLSYARLVGPIPQGLEIDHLCRQRSCVNPAHLEAVTGRVNVLRGDTVTAANARKTHCPVGHELTPENVYVHNRMRKCAICTRRRKREQHHRKKLVQMRGGKA